MEFFGGGLLVAEGVVENGANVGDEGRRQPEGAVVLDDGVFDVLDAQVRQITVAVLAAPADEVPVFLACPTGGLGEDQA
ncbi:hypothetical protein [Nocardia arizonensis]|uniref:hypothetical protein n=1 Tax=Nocardia arizonensis TaxID=1141647 RepID=UPI001EF53F33|nr:hypothetical protein [Nocardia arizonensis]